MNKRKLIILGKGPVCHKPMHQILSKEEIPGYDGEDVWTVATHCIGNADKYACMHYERKEPELDVSLQHVRKAVKNRILINNSVSVMLLTAVAEYGYQSVRIAGCPMLVGSEYTQQRESLFMMIGWLKALYGAEITWDNDIEKYDNYYTEYLGVKYEQRVAEEH